MKNIFLLISALCMTVCSAKAQIYDPVKWSVAAKKINKTEAVIFVKATIQSGWHIYGLNVPNGGPVSTSFNFLADKTYALNGKVAAPTPAKKFEKDFNMDIPFYANEVVFQQKIKLSGSSATVKGEVSFMACDKNQCLPPDDYQFSIVVK